MYYKVLRANVENENKIRATRNCNKNENHRQHRRHLMSVTGTTRIILSKCVLELKYAFQFVVCKYVWICGCIYICTYNCVFKCKSVCALGP